ncbi:MAG: amino acid permease [Bacteroidales bacterium]
MLKGKALFRRKSVSMILAHADDLPTGSGLNRRLGVLDLTSLGIAAIIGAGIFSTIGTAASYGGPAVSLLFVFTALACGFSALCYAEFAASIPISGSAYTYAYASFGELVAWIIGWDLIMEYAVGNIAVAISWSGYLTGLLAGLGIHVPEYLCIDYVSAYRGFHEVMNSGLPIDQVGRHLQEAWMAWQTAPRIGNIRLIADVPAFAIVVFISVLVYVGIYETKVAGNLMVLLKLVILLLVIGVGAFYVDPDNWSPFAPQGLAGVMKGTAGVFFAYIGFDAISTTAEEARNPRRDLPRAMILALLITTLLYVLISLVLTGMAPYHTLGVSDPLAYVFSLHNLHWLSGIIGLSAIIAMAGVLLVFQVGQPRIWMSMSRDGLLPKVFSRIHPRFHTPAFATVVAGFLVAVPSLFLNLTEVTDLTSIGTLFAFVLVSGGVLVLHPRGVKPDQSQAPRFVVPYFNSRYWLPPILLLTLALYYRLNDGLNFPSDSKGWHEMIPYGIFALISLIISFLAVFRSWSLIPVLGLLTNLYLMSELGFTNWMRFLVWLVIGLIIYFAYSFRKSRLISWIAEENKNHKL